MRLPLCVLLCAATLGIGCGGHEPSLPRVDEPLPELFSDLDAFDSDGVPRVNAIAYEPEFPLWTSGSEKTRWLVLPEAPIDTRTTPWVFPIGTYIFKSFAYEGVAVETRVMRLGIEGWEFAVYLWEGDDARLLDIAGPTPVPVSVGGVGFDHTVPSRRDCRTCHESNLGTEVVGLDAFQLRGQLDTFGTLGIFTTRVEPPEAIVSANADEAFVLGYLEGNCTHCHNGELGPSRSFDLRHPVALANLIDQPTDSSGSPAGIRVSPGDPSSSVLYQAFAQEIDFAMPALGVDVVDAQSVRRFREWILGLAE